VQAPYRDFFFLEREPASIRAHPMCVCIWNRARPARRMAGGRATGCKDRAIGPLHRRVGHLSNGRCKHKCLFGVGLTQTTVAGNSNDSKICKHNCCIAFWKFSSMEPDHGLNAPANSSDPNPEIDFPGAAATADLGFNYFDDVGRI
jgi:hypothetical protein